MPTSKDYSKLTVEELVKEEENIKSQKTATIILLVVLVGIAVYTATHKGFLLTITLLGISFLIGNRYSQRLKSVQAELNRRDKVL